MGGRTLLILFFTALAVRLIALLAAGEERATFPDTAEYQTCARNVVERGTFEQEGGLRARRPPLYVFYLALNRLLLGPSTLPPRLGGALLGAAACVLLALLAFRIAGPVPAWIAGFLAAFHPLLSFTSISLLGESVWAPLVIAEVWLLVEAHERNSWKLALAAGGCGGLASLGGVHHLLFVFVAGTAAWLLWRRRKLAALYAAAFVLAVAPWTLRNALVLKAFVPVTSQGGIALWEAFAPGATGGPACTLIAWPPEFRTLPEVEADRFMRRKAWEAAKANPARVAALAVSKQARFWSIVPNHGEYRTASITIVTVLAMAPPLPFLVYALFLWRRWSPGMKLVLLPIAYTAALHLVFIGSIRYRLPIEPFVLVIAAWTVWQIALRMKKKDPTPAATPPPPESPPR